MTTPTIHPGIQALQEKVQHLINTVIPDEKDALGVSQIERQALMGVLTQRGQFFTSNRAHIQLLSIDDILSIVPHRDQRLPNIGVCPKHDIVLIHMDVLLNKLKMFQRQEKLHQIDMYQINGPETFVFLVEQLRDKRLLPTLNSEEQAVLETTMDMRAFQATQQHYCSAMNKFNLQREEGQEQHLSHSTLVKNLYDTWKTFVDDPRSFLLGQTTVLTDFMWEQATPKELSKLEMEQKKRWAVELLAMLDTPDFREAIARAISPEIRTIKINEHMVLAHQEHMGKSLQEQQDRPQIKATKFFIQAIRNWAHACRTQGNSIDPQTILAIQEEAVALVVQDYVQQLKKQTVPHMRALSIFEDIERDLEQGLRAMVWATNPETESNGYKTLIVCQKKMETFLASASISTSLKTLFKEAKKRLSQKEIQHALVTFEQHELTKTTTEHHEQKFQKKRM